MKKRVIFISAAAVLILAAGGFVAYKVIKRSDQKAPAASSEPENNSAVATLTGTVVEKGCADPSAATLEDAYPQAANNAQRAEVAALVSQCASIDFKDMQKAVDWAKKAAADYRAAGNTEKADQFDLFVRQYEPFLADPSQQVQTIEGDREDFTQ